jgi:hypothetical protein
LDERRHDLRPCAIARMLDWLVKPPDGTRHGWPGLSTVRVGHQGRLRPVFDGAMAAL